MPTSASGSTIAGRRCQRKDHPEQARLPVGQSESGRQGGRDPCQPRCRSAYSPHRPPRDGLPDPDEYQLLKASFTNRWHPFLDFLVASGCRFSEAAALIPADIDVVNGTVRITKAWKRTQTGYEMGQPKTRRSVRTINVPSSVLDKLDFSHDWLFINSEGGPIRLYFWRTNVWVPSLTKARANDPENPDKVLLEKQPRIHDLRHTCASWLLGAGVPLITVSAHLGHEDAATTARVYGHLDRSAGRAAATPSPICCTSRSFIASGHQRLVVDAGSGLTDADSAVSRSQIDPRAGRRACLACRG